MSRTLKTVLCAAATLCVFSPQTSIHAQTAPTAPDPLLVVVTPNRSPTAVERSGSAITVIRGEELQKLSPGTLTDFLKGQPGISASATGGAGGTALVSIRGAETRHTLVLIDGIRVGDTTSTGGEFNFANLVATDIERIEILRGPQSALYGSDAIGGVINIITRKGRGTPSVSVQVEGGSYRSLSTKLAASGSTQTFNYAFAISGARTDGFSAYGHRIGRLRQFGPFDNDDNTRLAGTARFGWRPVNGVEIEGGIYAGQQRGGYDAAFAGFGYRPDTPSSQRGRLSTAFLRASVDTFDGLLKNQVTLSHSKTERQLNDVQRYPSSAPPFALLEERNRYAFAGNRTGVEYQGTLDFKQFGRTILGAAAEREHAVFDIIPVVNSFQALDRSVNKRGTQSVFLLHQLTLFDRLDLSAGGRIDKSEGVKAFNTGRVTAAYRIAETGTKLRASFGTGGKAPSLYQQFSIYAPSRNNDPALRPEHSEGGDVGIDQAFFDGRVNLSATYFANRIRNLIDFDSRRGACSFGLGGTCFFYVGQYINVARARTQGLELAADVDVLPGMLRIKGSFTQMAARDGTTGLKLARRPDQQGRISAVITPFSNLTLEPSVVVVGSRFSSPGERLRLAPYARLDMLVNYKLNASIDLYARGENLTNARYQEIKDYGTPGRSIYAGIRATW
jgi:vitamin B12 transporter